MGNLSWRREVAAGMNCESSLPTKKFLNLRLGSFVRDPVKIRPRDTMPWWHHHGHSQRQANASRQESAEPEQTLLRHLSDVTRCGSRRQEGAPASGHRTRIRGQRSGVAGKVSLGLAVMDGFHVQGTTNWLQYPQMEDQP